MDQLAALATDGSELEFMPPAHPEVLIGLERAPGVGLPPDLGGILSETDGMLGEYGSGLVWSARRVREDNHRFRTSFTETYMPFDSMLFFGDAGNGDQFALRILGNQAHLDVYVWNHEDDSRTWKAGDLRAYLDGGLTGTITA